MSEENEKKTGLDLKPAQIAAGALAAVTAAFLGSKLNVAGTVAGAAVASVVSTIGSALYQSSIERTRASVRRVGSKAWVVKPAAGRTDAEVVEEIEEDKVHTVPVTEVDTEDKTPETRRWPRIAAGALLVFVLGMLAVTGVEWVRGAPLSGGTEGTSLGAVVGKPTDRKPEAPPPSGASTPDAPSATTPPPSTTSGAPSTTTGSSAPSTSSQPSTTPSSTALQTSEAPPVQSTPAPPSSVGTPG
ncbi:hypothetical protein [Umezawaea sp. NPDC059074]|uniref:hypothetical protein n=1 Tax=Umezawaea sp. NPDC059074 TaxID=3346716 RepID=UPI0036A26CA1